MTGASRTDRGTRIFATACFSGPFLVVVYLMMRAVGTRGGPWLLGSQIVYLVPVYASAVLAAIAARRAPEGTRAVVVWRLVAVMTVLLVFSQTVYSADMVSGESTSMMLTGAANATNAIVMVLFVILVGLCSSSEGSVWRSSFTIALDVAIIGFAVLAVAYRYQLSGVPELLVVDDREALWLAAFSILGLTASGAGIALIGVARESRQAWQALMGLGASLVGLATVALVVGQQVSATGVTSTGMINGTVFLAGYWFIALGVAWRVSSTFSWEVRGLVASRMLAWPRVVVSSALLASVGVLAWLVVDVPTGSPGEAGYFAGLVLASLFMVARSMLASEELEAARSLAATDLLTGANNSRRLAERIDDLLSDFGALAEPFIVLLLDVDDFGVFNADRGREAGDELLADLARTLVRYAGHECVFRLAGDEFAVVASPPDAVTAPQYCRRLALACDSLGHDRPISVSAGYALCPEDGSDAETLISRARAAQQWGKHHGKHQVVRYRSQAMTGLADPDRFSRFEQGGSLEVARALLALADSWDQVGYRHSRNVATLAALLAERVGLGPERVREVELAALLHDVGKTVVPPGKRRARTARGSDPRAAHAVAGETLTRSVPVKGLPSWIRSHHEHWDGGGHPDGLDGERIPLESRILALADAYEVMTVGREGQPPMSKAAALHVIDLEIGARFDPGLTEQFIHIIGETDLLGWSDEWPAA